MFRYLFPGAVCLLLSAFLLGAQEKDLRFLHFLPDQRFSQTTISWITQDDKGFLWLATEDGLFRYDGYTFSHYKGNANLPGSLPHPLLFAVHQDERNGLWVGSSGGLYQYNPHRDNFAPYLPDPGDVSGAGGNFIQRICGDRDGNLWVATYNGLYALDPARSRFVHSPARPAAPTGLSHPHVRSLLIDRQNRLWAGTEAGLDRVDLPARKVTRYPADPGNPHGLSHPVVRCLYEDRAGKIWVGTENGLNQLDPATGRFTRYRRQPGDPHSLSSDTILSLMEDRRGRLWVGTWNGLNIREAGPAGFTRYRHDPADPAGISGNTVTALFTDNAGGIWVGTDKGVNRVELNKKRFHRYFSHNKSYKNPGHTVTALCEDGTGGYWIGTRNQVVRFDKTRNTYAPLDCRRGGRDTEIHSIARDKGGTLWIGSTDGFFAFNPARRRIRDFSHLLRRDVWEVYLDGDGVLWLGTDDGLYAFHPPTNRLRRFRDPGRPGGGRNHGIVTMAEDRAGFLWTGTQHGGLHRYDKRTGAAVRYALLPDNGTAPGSNRVTVIHEAARGGLWIGTNKGLHFLDTGSGAFTRFPDPDGKMGQVQGILEDDCGNLWISYREGIAKFNTVARAWSYYGVGDGLQYEYSHGNTLKNAAGEMFFCGENGLTVFHPDSIRDNPFAPPVVITRFSVFNKPVAPGGDLLRKSISETDEIRLSYREAIFSFEFAALNFTNPEKNHYAYKLDGFEADWNYVGTRRFASYSNIPGGKTYVFRVKAANDDGVWNPRETAVRIYISPPFWSTPWFILLSATAVAAGAFAFYKLRVRQYKRQRQELERQVGERTAEISRQAARLERQAEEIARINGLLRTDNRKLEENVKDLAQARVLQKEVTFADFQQIYPTDEACLKFLADLKWKEGYACAKCGNPGYSPGPVPYSRRCSRCSTIERATTGTIFSRIKFPITKGFYMVFLLSQGKNLTVDELSETLSHPRQTCWVFRKKVLQVISSREPDKRKEDGWSDLILSG